MKTVIEYEKIEEQVLFESIKDRECFYGGGTLYMKILKQDLEAYGIDCTNPVRGVNAISIINAGLTLFEPDERVFRSTKIIEHKKK